MEEGGRAGNGGGDDEYGDALNSEIFDPLSGVGSMGVGGPGMSSTGTGVPGTGAGAGPGLESSSGAPRRAVHKSHWSSIIRPSKQEFSVDRFYYG